MERKQKTDRIKFLVLASLTCHGGILVWESITLKMYVNKDK